MTPAQIRRVRRSFAAAVLKLDVASDAFCRHLHRLDPGRGPLFDGDPMARRVRVGAMLAGLVGTLEQPDAVRPALWKLVRPASRDLTSQQYALIKEALMAALRETLGDGFDAATHRAWLLAYDRGVRAMATATPEERDKAQAA